MTAGHLDNTVNYTLAKLTSWRYIVLHIFLSFSLLPPPPPHPAPNSPVLSYFSRVRVGKIRRPEDPLKSAREREPVLQHNLSPGRADTKPIRETGLRIIQPLMGMKLVTARTGICGFWVVMSVLFFGSFSIA